MKEVKERKKTSYTTLERASVVTDKFKDKIWSG
jgi:hypothetical protein